jgi:capsular polysaccharide transport system permease protein
MALERSRLLAGWSIQAKYIYALLVRDMIMRYGRGNIGFTWVVLEPMILTAGVLIIWPVMGASKYGIKIVELVFTGYMLLTLWRHITNNAVNLFRNSASLLYHRRVTLLDIVIARQGLEFIGASTALVAIWVVLYNVGAAAEIQRPDLLLGGWFLMGWIAIACAMILAALTEVSQLAERFIQPFQYLNIPISGAFFLVDWLPPWGQKLILYHPLVHSYELFRAGYFGSSVITHYDVAYAVAWAFGLSFLGILAVNGIRSRVRLT